MVNKFEYSLMRSQSEQSDSEDGCTDLILQPYADYPIKASPGDQCAGNQVYTSQKADQ